MGALIQHSGGLRKVRWKLKDTGKRGGLRVIYYWVTADEHIYLLLAYPKSEQDNLTLEQRMVLKTIVERWSDEK